MTKVCLVTGATGGIGLEIARGLAGSGASVVLTGRNRERGELARREIMESTGNDRVSLLIADFGLMTEVSRLAQEFRDRFDRLDLLINNAALLTRRRELTSEGLERTFAVNHLAAFQLTRLLTPDLRTGAPSKLINISSNAHRWVDALDFDNLQQENGFSVRTGYGMQKLMNLMHALEFSRRFSSQGISATAHHPGEVATNLGNRGPLWLRVYWNLAARSRLTPAEGAKPIVDAALTTSEITGKYFERGVETEPLPAARDLKASERLWEISEQLLDRVLG